MTFRWYSYHAMDTVWREPWGDNVEGHRCANCGIPIAWAGSQVVRGGQTYCCDGCARGGPCCCSYPDMSGWGVALEAMKEDQS
ncbi:MAG: hypothetical protein AB1603_07380 [Chloroflexota bacterium]